MTYYYHTIRAEVRQLDPALVAAWTAAGNPKAAEWTAIPDPPAGATHYDGTQWIVPAPYVPQVVSPFQARAALAQAGLLAQAEAAVAATDEVTKLAWQYAQEFRRNSPTLLTLATALGLTEAQLDELFTTAAGIAA